MNGPAATCTIISRSSGISKVPLPKPNLVLVIVLSLFVHRTSSLLCCSAFVINNSRFQPPVSSLSPIQGSNTRIPTIDILSRLTGTPNMRRSKRIVAESTSSNNNDNAEDTANITPHPSSSSSISSGPKQPELNAVLKIVGKTTSAFVSLTFFAFLAFRRDAYMISFFLGAISNGILSKVLKKLLNHDRPAELDLNESIKLKPSDGGMPSSHAMSLAFIGTYVALAVWDSMPWLVGTIVMYAMTSLYYRVKSNLHTIEQVVVGLVLGITNGFIWRDLSLGTSQVLPSVHVIDWVSVHILPEMGVLPPIYLLIPAAVGAAVVGSFERRISLWIKSSGDDKGINSVSRVKSD